MSSSAATASIDVGARDGRGSVAPPMPSSPCTNCAVSSGRSRGTARPACSGMSAPPHRSSVTMALRTARSSGTLPATTVTARTSTAGSRTASTRAIASSDAVSVSITMLRIGEVCPLTRPQPHPKSRGIRTLSDRFPTFFGGVATGMVIRRRGRARPVPAHPSPASGPPVRTISTPVMCERPQRHLRTPGVHRGRRDRTRATRCSRSGR